jgi:hypothetical protein
MNTGKGGTMSKRELEDKHGQVWDEHEVKKHFDILGHADPICVAMRKCDKKLGSLKFQHTPRFYWGFVEDIGR